MLFNALRHDLETVRCHSLYCLRRIRPIGGKHGHKTLPMHPCFWCWPTYGTSAPFARQRHHTVLMSEPPISHAGGTDQTKVSVYRCAHFCTAEYKCAYMLCALNPHASFPVYMPQTTGTDERLNLLYLLDSVCQVGAKKDLTIFLELLNNDGKSSSQPLGLPAYVCL